MNANLHPFTNYTSLVKTVLHTALRPILEHLSTHNKYLAETILATIANITAPK